MSEEWRRVPTSPGEVSVGQMAGWRSALDDLHARAPRFARSEVPARAGRFLAALLARVEHENG